MIFPVAQVPVGENPTANVSTVAVNGSSTSFMRADGAPAIDQTMAPTWTGLHTFAVTARSSGVASYFDITSPADTGLTASTESIGIDVNASATRTWAAGALTTQREIVYQAPTYAFAGASTITTAVTTEITGPPIAGTHATLTNKWGLRVYSGAGTGGGGAIVARANNSLSDGHLLEIQDYTGTAQAYFGYNGALTLASQSITIAGSGSTCFLSLGSVIKLTGSGSPYIGYIDTYSQLLIRPGVNGGSSPYNVTVQAQKASDTPFSIQAVTSQAADQQQWLASNGTTVQSRVTSAGWIQNTQGRARLATAATNATATMAAIGLNIASSTPITLIAGRIYTGFMLLYANNSTAAEGLQFDFNGGTATMTSFEAGFAAMPPGSALALGTLTTTALGTPLTVTTATTADALYLISITAVCNAGGTFIPRFAEVTHVTGTATVELGSYLWLEDMPF